MRIDSSAKISIWSGEVIALTDTVTVPLLTHGISDISPSDRIKAAVKQSDSGGALQFIRGSVSGTDIVLNLNLGVGAVGDGVLTVKIYR